MILDERVRAELASSTRFRDVRLLDSVDSTNRMAAGLALQGAPEGLVVSADWQSAGRGRLERTWEAAPGDGLLVSVLVRPRDLPLQRWHLVTAATALAAQDACVVVADVRPDIKWPNDLLVGDGKLAGILAEAAAGAVVVGMGLNVHAGPPGAAVLDRVAGRRVDRADVLAAWLRALDVYLGDWSRVAAEYRSRCATVGMDVSVELRAGELLTGRAEGVDESGRLIVADAAGSRTPVAVGDVTHVRGASGKYPGRP